MTLIFIAIMVVLAAVATALVFELRRSIKTSDECLKHKFIELLQKEKPDPADFPDFEPEEVLRTWTEAQWNIFKRELS
jgi:hypothetical protein